MKRSHFVAVTAALSALAACAQLLGMQDFERAERSDAKAVEAPDGDTPPRAGFNINQPLKACGVLASPPAVTGPSADFKQARYYVTSLRADLDGLNLDGLDTMSAETAQCLSRGTVVVDGREGVDNAFSTRPLTSELIRAIIAPIELGQFGVLFEMNQLQLENGGSTIPILQLYGVRAVDGGVAGLDAGTDPTIWHKNPQIAPVLGGWLNDAGSFAFTTAPEVEFLDIQLPGSLKPPYYLQLRIRHPVVVGCFTGPLPQDAGNSDAGPGPIEYDTMGRPKNIEVLIAGSVLAADFARMGSQIEYPTNSGSLVCQLPPEFKNSVAGQFCEGRDMRIAPADKAKPECDAMSVGFHVRAQLIERRLTPDPSAPMGIWNMDPTRCEAGTELRCAD